MPIPVTCPECDSKFKADDDRAGKKDTCPECGERVPVPEASAKPATARPVVVAARPVTAKPVAAKPEDDDEDDAPKSKRRAADADDAEDEKPKGKRRRDEDEEDDAPKSKRRRREDDDADEKPKKKGGSGLMIVGIIAVVLLLLVGGGGAAVYFLAIEPMAKKAKEENDAIQVAIDEEKKNSSAGKITQPNVAKITKGMTLAQCQEVLGKGAKAMAAETSLTLARLPNSFAVRTAWEGYSRTGQVYRWTDNSDSVAVLFDADPTAAGKVVGVIADVGGKGTNPVVFGGFSPKPPDEPLPSLSADALVQKAATYAGKVVIVSGTVKAVGDAEAMLDLKTIEAKGLRLWCSPQKWVRGKCKPGDVVWATGRVKAEAGELVELTDGEVTSHIPGSGPTNPPVGEPMLLMTADALSAGAAKYTGKVVSVSGVIAKVTDQGVGGGSVELTVSGTKKGVRVSFDAPNWKGPKLKVGDLLSSKGTVEEGTAFVEVVQSEVTLHNPGTPPRQTALPLVSLLIDLDKYQGKVVTLRGRVLTVTEDPNKERAVVQIAREFGEKFTVRMVLDKDNWRSGLIAADDTVEVKGLVPAGKLPTDGKDGQIIEMTGCELVKRTDKDGKVVAVPPKPDPSVLTVAQVVKEYDTHKGKVVTVQGRVEFREEDISRTRGVVAFDPVPGEKNTVRAALEKGFWRTNFLADGDTLTLKGKVTDGPLFDDGRGGKIITLKDCELVNRVTKDGKTVPIPAKTDPPADDAVAVKADDMLAEYIKDSAAAATKYKDKTVKITGAVQSTTAQSVVLGDKTDGDTAYKVSITFPLDRRATITPLKTGDTVTITAKVLVLTTTPGGKSKTLRLTDGKVEK